MSDSFVCYKLKDFLSERLSCTRVGSSRSEHKRFREGLSQGSVLPPLLFLVWISGPRITTLKTETSFFADDLAVAAQDTNLETVGAAGQEAADTIANWAEE